jgi:hypothetical protein
MAAADAAFHHPPPNHAVAAWTGARRAHRKMLSLGGVEFPGRSVVGRGRCSCFCCSLVGFIEWGTAFPGAMLGGGRVVNLGLSFSSHIFARLAGGHCARKESSWSWLLGAGDTASTRLAEVWFGASK